jgi:hypothetical protein
MNILPCQHDENAVVQIAPTVDLLKNLDSKYPQVLEAEKIVPPHMGIEAAEAGRYASKLWHEKDYPKIQILTIEGLLDGTERVDAPPPLNPFAKARRESKPARQQEML